MERESSDGLDCMGCPVASNFRRIDLQLPVFEISLALLAERAALGAPSARDIKELVK